MTPVTAVPETYFRTTVGDSLVYGTYVMSVESTVALKGRNYVLVNNFPCSEFSRKYAVRRDAEGNVFVVRMSDTTETEYPLLKAGVKTGTSWSYIAGATATVESTTDTVICGAGTFKNCVKLRIQWWSLEYDILWFAPGIGIVKREFDTASARPIAVGNLELSNYRLK